MAAEPLAWSRKELLAARSTGGPRSCSPSARAAQEGALSLFAPPSAGSQRAKSLDTGRDTAVGTARDTALGTGCSRRAAQPWGQLRLPLPATDGAERSTRPLAHIGKQPHTCQPCPCQLTLSPPSRPQLGLESAVTNMRNITGTQIQMSRLPSRDRTISTGTENADITSFPTAPHARL